MKFLIYISNKIYSIKQLLISSIVLTFMTNFSIVYALNYNDVFIQDANLHRSANIMEDELKNNNFATIRYQRLRNMNNRMGVVFTVSLSEFGSNVSINSCTIFALTGTVLITAAHCIARVQIKNKELSEFIEIKTKTLSSMNIVFPATETMSQLPFIIQRQKNNSFRKERLKDLRLTAKEHSFPIPYHLNYINNPNELQKFNYYGDTNYTQKNSYPINITKIFLPKTIHNMTNDIAIIQLSTPILGINNTKVYLEQEPIAESDKGKDNVILLVTPDELLNDRNKVIPMVFGFGVDARTSEAEVNKNLKFLELSANLSENFDFNFSHQTRDSKYRLIGYGASKGDSGGPLISYKNRYSADDYKNIYFGGVVHASNGNPKYFNNMIFEPYMYYTPADYQILFVRVDKSENWINQVISGDYTSSTICDLSNKNNRNHARFGMRCWFPGDIN